jgi:hypothetical protein
MELRSYDRKHHHSLLKELQHFLNVPDDYDPDLDDTDDRALRENILELFCDARTNGITVPQTDWKRLGIGYGPIGGQQFPEACALDKTVRGPQGEVLYVDAPCRVADSSVASGTDRSLFSIFADRELYPYVVEKCDGGDAAYPEEKLRYRIRFADGSKNDSLEFTEDELDELDD